MQVIQGSKKFTTAILLTLCGGYLDAYTYFERGGVFANAQTGNIIKLGIQLGSGNPSGCVRCLIPIVSFILGVFTANLFEIMMEKRDIHYIRRGVLAAEMAVLSAAAFIPAKEEYSFIANALVSFACAMQMEAFKTFENQPLATVVSTGNLRKFVDFTIKGICSRRREDFRIAAMYGLIVLIFIAGVIAGTLVSRFAGTASVLAPVFFMALCIVNITVNTKYIEEEK